ncbi:ATP-binding protein [Hydrogenoanaerobacterium sp.]|uniref:ATP-binding protein n=1 Tax=Hydrogenoanaerobacterium sp. TaxID=2953763 RepID=UPI00289AE47B|nr:ATP-binding protein [Hydrogenoanaerobacterium sp.]
MIFHSLKITEGLFERYIDLSDKSNLIYSKKNSTGKTTLMRFLLYSLGYPVPSTKNIRFEKCVTETTITCSMGKITILRNDEYLEVGFENGSKEHFVLPTDQNAFHAKVYGTENNDLLNNILGVFYVDQEKGWTLLNRGIIIGKIRFNIEQLVRGLSDRSCDDLTKELRSVEQQLSKYKQMFSVAEYQQEINEAENNIVFETKDEEEQKLLEMLNSEISSLETELKRVNAVIAENNSFKNFIEKMKIAVKGSDGNPIPVNRDTIIGFDFSVEFLLAKRKMISSKISTLKSKAEKYERKQTEQLQLVKTETLIESFDRNISKIEVDQMAVSRVISSLEKEKSKLKKQITLLTKHNNDVVTRIHNTIMKYAKELDFEQYIIPSSDYIFTDDLKSLSGTILHKIVFSFKLAYIVEVQKKLNMTLPIILDSPSGREITKENVKAMIDILNRDFSDNQIIIASIFQYDIDNINVIEIEDRLINELRQQ